MPTLVFCCGAECSVVGPGATPGTGGVNHWNTIGTVAPVIDTSVPRSGAQCYKFVPATTSTSFLANTLSGAPTVGVARFAVRFAALPSTSCNLFSFNTAGSWCFVHYIQSANQFGLSNSSAATSATTGGPTLAIDTWYVIDFSADVHANPWVLKAKVNGGTEFSKSPATTASSFTGYRVGGNVDATTLQPASVNIFVDDIAVSQTGADYPLGAGAVAGLLPAGDGTHNFNANTDFLYENTTNVATSATDTYTHVDARCSTTIGTFMAVPAAANTEYLEWTYQASPSDVSSVNGVQVVMSSHSSGTSANKQTLRLNDNGTTNDVCTDLDQSQTTITYHTKHYATAPSTGAAWTKTRVDALRTRWNSSFGTVDESPVPFIDGVVLEVDYIQTSNPVTVAPGVGSGSYSAFAAAIVIGVSVAAGLGTATYAATAPTIQTPVSIAVGVGTGTWTGLAPTIALPVHVTPGLGAGSYSAFAPTVALPVVTTPAVGAGTWTGFLPTVVIASSGTTAAPGTGLATWTAAAPTVALSANQFALPGTGLLTVAGLAPTVLIPAPPMRAIPVYVFEGLPGARRGGAFGR